MAARPLRTLLVDNNDSFTYGRPRFLSSDLPVPHLTSPPYCRTHRLSAEL